MMPSSQIATATPALPALMGTAVITTGAQR
jgi:hypothetical protein